MSAQVGTVYLLHFDPPFKHARHYAGFTTLDPDDRRLRHMAGRGARLVEAAVAAGCQVTIVRLWPDVEQGFERTVKGSYADGARGGRMHNRSLTRLCPACTRQPTVVAGQHSQLLADYRTDGQLQMEATG